MRGRAVVAREPHKLKVEGSNPSPATILKVIKRAKEVTGSRGFFTHGGCYLFYRILKSYFDCEPYYDQDHIITKIGDKFYDITGEVDGTNHLLLIEEPRSFRFFEPLEKI